MKNKLMKISKTVIASTIVLFALSACGKSNEPIGETPTPTPTTQDIQEEPSTPPANSVVEKIKASGKIVMGTNATFYPFEYVESNGDIVGFDIELGKKIAEKLGVEFEVVDLPFQSLLVNLAADSVDFVAAGMTIKPDRLVNTDFSNTYFDAKQVVLVMNDNDSIKTMDDLKGLRIGTQASTTGEEIAEELSENAVSYTAIAIASLDMTQDKLDALIVDIEPAKGLVNANTNLKIIEFSEFEDEEYAIAVQKLDDGKNDLVDLINEVLDEIKENGEFDKLVTQFFG